VLDPQVSHHLRFEGRNGSRRAERATVKTFPRGAAAPAWSPLDPHQDELVLGRYRLLEMLGSGGHGSVWIARDEQDGGRVAVKRIPLSPGDPQERARIVREGRAAARLAHPAIVALYGVGDEAGAHYLVSELVDGPSLAWLYAQRSLDARLLLEIGSALASALSHAHERGVVHRDVKPANVIVPVRRGAAPAKLTDFGVARLSGEAPLTRSGDVVGTLAYMAPEQADGGEAGPAADLYSLALTLYEGLTGRNPLRGETVAATARLVGSPVPPLGRLRGDLDPGLCTAIDRALSPAPRARGTLASLQAAIDHALDPSGPPPPSPADPGATVADGGGVLLAPDGGLTVRVAPPDVQAPAPAARRRPAVRAVARPVPARARRLASSLATGVLCGASLSLLSGEHQRAATAVSAAALATVLVAISTSVGWLLLGLGAIAWLGAIGHPGAALVLAAGLVPVAVALERRPWLWSVSGAAPALATIGLGAAAPALAGRLGGGVRSRAALGALSYWWVSIAEAFSGRRLVLGQPAGVRALVTWQGSIGGALHHALIPICADPRLWACVGLWAFAAAVLPWVVRGPLTPERAIAAAVWAAALTVGGVEIAGRLGTPRPPVPLACWALATVLAAAAPIAARRPHQSAGVP